MMHNTDEPQPIELGENKRKLWRRDVLSKQQEPQAIQLPVSQEPPVVQPEPDSTQPFKTHEPEYYVRQRLHVRLEGNKVPLDVIEWLMEHASEESYDFKTSETHAIIDYLPNDDEKPPSSWR